MPSLLSTEPAIPFTLSTPVTFVAGVPIFGGLLFD
jgi:hypothetical protein